MITNNSRQTKPSLTYRYTWELSSSNLATRRNFSFCIFSCWSWSLSLKASFIIAFDAQSYSSLGTIELPRDTWDSNLLSLNGKWFRTDYWIQILDNLQHPLCPFRDINSPWTNARYNVKTSLFAISKTSALVSIPCEVNLRTQMSTPSTNRISRWKTQERRKTAEKD